MYYCSSKFQSGCFNVIQSSISTDMAIMGGLTLAIALPMVYTLDIIFTLNHLKLFNSLLA